MQHSRPLYGGLDVHKDSSAVADGANDHDAEVISLGPIGTRQCDIDQRVRQLQAKATPLVFVYEAGPWGYWRYRELPQTSYDGWVVAPSLIPKQAGDHVKPDRRDAVHWARLLRSGALTPVDVPTVEDDAIRDLRRAREATLHDVNTATFRRKALLLRHDIRSTGRATWGPAHRRWRSEVVCPTPAQPIVLQEDVRAVTEHTERLHRRAQDLHEHVNAWRLSPVVEALQALRGVQVTVAVTLIAKLGDLTRVDNPRPRMKYVGLTPAEDARGERRRQGGITKTGPTPARRALLEGAWADRDPAQVSRHLQRRLEKLPKPLQDIRWKAQARLCKRSRQLSARGTHPHQVVVASARELIALMWAIAKQVPVTASIRRPHGRCIEGPQEFQGKVPLAIGRGAAPVWCTPRAR